jgi:hypothetical protein
MQIECSAYLFGFAPVERRTVAAGFDGGRMTSDAGALLLGERRIGRSGWSSGLGERGGEVVHQEDLVDQ